MVWAAWTCYFRVVLTLNGRFEHHATVRSHLWDLSNLLSLQAFIQYIQDDHQRALAQTIVARFTAQVLPVLPQLPTAVAQNDANDHNIVMDSSHEHVAALLDFGDMVKTARVNELAICVAYGNATATDCAWDQSTLTYFGSV
jgi:Ser/Thr protein kinase RdoA (MazF antagonist)